MAGRYTRRFFDEPKNQSKVKHRAYEAYLTPWSQAVLSTSSRAWIVDGFAGPGKYASGEPGSPQLALDRAHELATHRASSPLQCLFAERGEEHRRELRHLTARYSKVSAQVMDGDFWSRISQIPEIVRDDPVLLFVDPFGLASLDFKKLSWLVASLPFVDTLINLRTPAAARLASRLADRISDAVGSDDWIASDPTSVGAAFCSNLQRAAGTLPPASFLVRDRLGGRVQTELILAARHPKAYELWNDRMVIEAEELHRLSGVESPPRAAGIDTVERRLCAYVERQTSWTRKELVDRYMVENCGDVHSGVVKQSATNLLRKATWIRLRSTGSIDTDQLGWGQRWSLFPDDSG